MPTKMSKNRLNILVSMLNDVHHLINVLYYYAQASLAYSSNSLIHCLLWIQFITNTFNRDHHGTT